VYGQAEYEKTGDRPEHAALSARLLNKTGNRELARTPELNDGYVGAQANWVQGLNVGGVLLKSRDAADRPDGSAYEADPGKYKLRLFGGAFGNCGSDDPGMSDITLSYMLLGDTP
jgi:hypothetical protein